MQVEVSVLRMHGTDIAFVTADSTRGLRLRTVTPPGCGYDIETWVFDLNRAQPERVLIVMNK